MSNPYLEAAKAVPTEEERDQENALPAAQAFAAERSPERSAELLKKARAAGMSLELLEAEAEKAPAVDWREVTRGLPVTRDTLADPERAAAMQDDIAALAAIEKVFGGMSEIAWETKTGFERGRINQRLAEIGYRQSQGLATPEEVAEADRLEAQSATIPRPPLGLVPRGFRAAAESAPLMLSSTEASKEQVFTWGITGALAGATVGGVATAPAGGAGAVPGAVTGFLVGTGRGFQAGMGMEVGRQEQGLAYREHLGLPEAAQEKPMKADATAVLKDASPLVAELEIHGELGEGHDYIPSPGSNRVIPLLEVLRQIETTWARGSRVLLLSVDSGGGSGWSGRVLFHFLRCWSEHGGRVVAHVRHALSNAALYILGADVVVMDRQGLIGPHGPVLGNPSGGAADAAFMARMREQNGAVFVSRTLLPPKAVAAFLGSPGTLEKPAGFAFGVDWARTFGFVDFVGGRGKARKIARRLARGKRVTSPRQASLARRVLPPEVPALVERLRAEARGFLKALESERP